MAFGKVFVYKKFIKNGLEQVKNFTRVSVFSLAYVGGSLPKLHASSNYPFNLFKVIFIVTDYIYNKKYMNIEHEMGYC